MNPKKICVGVVFAAVTAFAQTGTERGEWRHYAGDNFSSKYSPLDQINGSNVNKLKIAWRWSAQNFGSRQDFNWEVTPLMVGGVLYFTAGTGRQAVAIDAATGETLWTYRHAETGRGSVRANNRGVSYWSDGKGDDRILFITLGYQLVALNAKTGQPIPSFGNKGAVDLFLGLDRQKIDPGTIGSTSPAMIVKDVAVVGAALISGGSPKSMTNVPGYVRGFDVRTGKLAWTFHTIPQTGEFGNDTWEKDSWKYTGNTAVWAPMSADEELGYVYLPVETPTGDYFGGHRPGNGLFGETLVCLDAKTGKRVWHYQFIHHGIWDWDIASAPNLLDITVDGRRVKAVAQVTKQGWVYTFDRVTGKPIWPIEERPVPKGDVPGEWYSPTQPIPTKPAAFERQGFSENDVIDFSPEIKAEALKIISQYKLGPIYTPPSVFDANGKKGTLQLPAVTGGANWQGAGVDPETGYLYIPSVTTAWVNALEKAGDRSDMAYIARPQQLEKVRGLPVVKPPWGRITAINMNTGEHAWMVPNGEAPDYVKENPAVKGVDISGWGNPERAPILITKTLLFAGDGPGLFSSTTGAGGNTFRVLDKATGKKLFEMKLPARETSMPMTYMQGGKQYVVVAIGDSENGPKRLPAELIALTVGE